MTNAMDLWQTLDQCLDLSAMLIDGEKKAHDQLHALQDLAAQVSGGLIPSAIGPCIYKPFPKASVTLDVINLAQSLCSTGGLVLAEVRSSKLSPSIFVRIYEISVTSATISENPDEKDRGQMCPKYGRTPPIAILSLRMYQRVGA